MLRATTSRCLRCDHSLDRLDEAFGDRRRHPILDDLLDLLDRGLDQDVTFSELGDLLLDLLRGRATARDLRQLSMLENHEISHDLAIFMLQLLDLGLKHPDQGDQSIDPLTLGRKLAGELALILQPRWSASEGCTYRQRPHRWSCP